MWSVPWATQVLPDHSDPGGKQLIRAGDSLHSSSRVAQAGACMQTWRQIARLRQATTLPPNTTLTQVAAWCIATCIQQVTCTFAMAEQVTLFMYNPMHKLGDITSACAVTHMHTYSVHQDQYQHCCFISTQPKVYAYACERGHTCGHAAKVRIHNKQQSSSTCTHGCRAVMIQQN
jgi:hypothetical protein